MRMRRRSEHIGTENKRSLVALTKDRGTEDPFALFHLLLIVLLIVLMVLNLNYLLISRITFCPVEGVSGSSLLSSDQKSTALLGYRSQLIPLNPIQLNSINYSLPRGPKVRHIKGEAAIRLDKDYV